MEWNLVMCDKHLKDAAIWYKDLLKAETADAKPENPVKVKGPKAPTCPVCDEKIETEDWALCSGCGIPVCPECMGPDEYCQKCEASDE